MLLASTRRLGGDISPHRAMPRAGLRCGVTDARRREPARRIERAGSTVHRARSSLLRRTTSSELEGGETCCGRGRRSSSPGVTGTQCSRPPWRRLLRSHEKEGVRIRFSNIRASWFRSHVRSGATCAPPDPCSGREAIARDSARAIGDYPNEFEGFGGVKDAHALHICETNAQQFGSVGTVPCRRRRQRVSRDA